MRKRKNIHNILLKEGMKIIIEKLDIINLFIKIYKDEKKKDIIVGKNEFIEVSEECKKTVHEIYINTVF